MKSFKCVGAVALATVLLFSSFSFSAKKVDKEATATRYYYVNIPYRKIGSGNVLSLVPIFINMACQWDPTPMSLTYSSNGSYLRAIDFLEEFDCDGGSDAELTLQEAVDAVEAYYVSHLFTLPPDGYVITVDNFANIVIKRSDSNN